MKKNKTVTSVMFTPEAVEFIIDSLRRRQEGTIDPDVRQQAESLADTLEHVKATGMIATPVEEFEDEPEPYNAEKENADPV